MKKIVQEGYDDGIERFVAARILPATGSFLLLDDKTNKNKRLYSNYIRFCEDNEIQKIQTETFFTVYVRHILINRGFCILFNMQQLVGGFLGKNRKKYLLAFHQQETPIILTAGQRLGDLRKAAEVWMEDVDKYSRETIDKMVDDPSEEALVLWHYCLDARQLLICILDLMPEEDEDVLQDYPSKENSPEE